MIQYHYIHKDEGYVAELSVSSEHESYRFNMNLFEQLRTSISGEYLAYATLDNGTFSFLSSASKANQAFLEGVSGQINELTANPANFIGCFRLQSLQLGQASLPRATVPSLRPNIDPIMLGKLVDALIFGQQDRQIILYSDDGLAKSYLQALSYVLPEPFLRRVGFCVDCTNVPDNFEAFNSGRTLKVEMRVILPRLENFNYDYYANSYYVFDLSANGQDNYASELSSLGQVISNLQLVNVMFLGEIKRDITRAFSDDGSVDKTELNKICALTIFNQKKDLASARELIKNNPQDVKVAVMAISAMLEEQNAGSLTIDDRHLICEYYKNYSGVKNEIDTSYNLYLISNLGELIKEEKDLLFDMTAKDQSGQKLMGLFAHVRYMNLSIKTQVFELFIEVLGRFSQVNGQSVATAKDLLFTASECFDVERLLGNLPLEQQTKGEEIFDLVAKQTDENIRVTLIAVLMACAYKTTASDSATEVRIRGFIRLLNSIKLAVDKIALITMVKNKLDEFAMFIPELALFDSVDFLMNYNYTKKVIIPDIVKGLDVEGLLTAFERVKIGAKGNYQSLQGMIEDRLLDIELLRAKVKCGQPIFTRYREFFSIISVSKQNAHPDIAKFIDELATEQDVGDSFAKYRYDFAYGCFETMSEKTKRKICGEVGSQVFKFDDTPKEKRQAVVESTVDNFGTIELLRQGKGLKRKFFSIWSFAFSLLSLVILLLPAVLQAVGLSLTDGTQIVENILDFFNPYFCFVAVYVFALHALSYLSLRKKKLLRANKITFWCGILPLLVFIFAYLVFYFLGVKIDLLF